MELDGVGDEFHHRLRTSERRLRTLIERLPGVVYVDAPGDGRSTRYVSPQIEALVGYTPREWLDDADLWQRLIHPDDRDAVLDARRTSHETGEPFVAEYRVRARDGRSVWIRDEAVLVDDEEPEWQGLITDVTERKQAKERLEFLAFHDAVTGLPNAAFFEQHLELEVARARRSGETLAICALDLDKFKLVNDTLGHAAGDAFLREVARRVQACLRESDLVARVGGDEFLVIAPSLTPGADAPLSTLREAADRFSARLADALEPPFVMADMELHMSASIGTALFPHDGQVPQQLLARADATMYRSKRERDADDVVYVDGGDHVRGELSLASSLRRAARDGSWTLAHQPIVELVLGRAIGAESLLRWHDPVHGDVEPRRFIAMAEELGLISNLGAWVIERLTTLCRTWADAGVLDEMRMLTYNLSPRELWHPALMDRLEELRDAAGRDGLIAVEITESSLMMDPARASSTLRDIRDLGIRIALDDFGTGYSSLSRLQSLPIDLVKIDRTFLGDVNDPSARSIVQAMIRLANALEMVTVAEGIETMEQLRFVTDLGCPLAQGRLFSDAIPADDLTSILGRDISPLAQIRGT